MTEKLKAVEKALKILQILKNYEEGLGTDEISKELNFTMQTVSRFLYDLSRHGFVPEKSVGKKYILGNIRLINVCIKTHQSLIGFDRKILS